MKYTVFNKMKGLSSLFCSCTTKFFVVNYGIKKSRVVHLSTTRLLHLEY